MKDHQMRLFQRYQTTLLRQYDSYQITKALSALYNVFYAGDWESTPSFQEVIKTLDSLKTGEYIHSVTVGFSTQGGETRLRLALNLRRVEVDSKENHYVYVDLWVVENQIDTTTWEEMRDILVDLFYSRLVFAPALNYICQTDSRDRLRWSGLKQFGPKEKTTFNQNGEEVVELDRDSMLRYFTWDPDTGEGIDLDNLNEVTVRVANQSIIVSRGSDALYIWFLQRGLDHTREMAEALVNINRLQPASLR